VKKFGHNRDGEIKYQIHFSSTKNARQIEVNQCIEKDKFCSHSNIIQNYIHSYSCVLTIQHEIQQQQINTFTASLLKYLNLCLHFKCTNENIINDISTYETRKNFTMLRTNLIILMYYGICYHQLV